METNNETQPIALYRQCRCGAWWHNTHREHCSEHDPKSCALCGTPDHTGRKP